MTVSADRASPSPAARALGMAGILGGVVLLAAFVVDIRPDLNWVRLMLFNVGAIAIAVALARRAKAPRTAVVTAAGAVILANTLHLVMTALSLGVERPFAGDFGFVLFLVAAAMWLGDAAFGVVLSGRRDLTSSPGGRLGAIALAAGSLLAIIGMDRLGLVSPNQDPVFKTLALAGILLNGLAWIVLGLDVVVGRRSVAGPNAPPEAALARRP